MDFSNLQRQILFDTADVGQSKTGTARSRLQGINPHVEVTVHEARLSAANALDLIAPYDIVIDGTDNFPTRYCVNDACVMLKKPNAYGSIFRFEGQATLFDPRPADETAGSTPAGPCYRCLYPEPPPPGMVPSCAEGGVLGILPGVIGSIQATEAIKVILDVGQNLVGRLVRYSALDMTFKTLKIRRDPACPMCGDNRSIQELIDYEQFCGIRGEESTTTIRQDAIPEINVQQLKDMLGQLESGNTEFELIDVREAHEHAIVNLPQAKLIPLGTLPGRMSEFDPSKRYVVHCKLGGRSAQAVEQMRAAGLDATNVAGGITAWAEQIDPTLPTY